MVMVLLILELRKIKREMGMAVQSNKTESNGETACDETEKPEGLSKCQKSKTIATIISKPMLVPWSQKKGYGVRKKTNSTQNYFCSNPECE